MPISELGPLHHGRKYPQPPRSELREFHRQAQDRLAHFVNRFEEEEIETVGRAVCVVIADRGHVCHACSILPDHVHLVMRRHTDYAEKMIERFQLASKQLILAQKKRPPNHPVWGGPGWKVFLNTVSDFDSRIKYVEKNYLERGLPVKQWSFVNPYDGWLP